MSNHGVGAGVSGERSEYSGSNRDEAEVLHDANVYGDHAPSSSSPEVAPAAGKATKPSLTADITNLNDLEMQNLVVWNAAAFVFQVIQAAALFYLSSEAENDWYLYSNFPSNLNDRDSVESNFGQPSSKKIAGYPITWYSAVFILLSGVDHLTVILPCFRGTYEYYLQRHQNPFRWAEYAVSASLMRVMIAQISGVTDIHLLFSIFMQTATTMILGACHESVNAKARADGFRQNWFPYMVSWVPHFSAWLVIFCYFFYSVSNGGPPAFVWSIVFILFFLDASFAVLFYLQWAQVGPFQDYILGEKGFIVLSFTAKALLAWISYGGGSR